MPVEPEIELSKELVYDGKLFKVYKERVRLPDGGERPREIVVHPGAVALVVVDDSSRLVLDWDGTATMVDTLWLVLEQFGDYGVFRGAGERLMRGELSYRDLLELELPIAHGSTLKIDFHVGDPRGHGVGTGERVARVTGKGAG